MSTTQKSVHVFADKMTIHSGPSRETLLSLPRWKDCHDRKACSVEMTLQTAASSRSFRRKVTITETFGEMKESEILELERFYAGSLHSVRYHIRGFISDWHFYGIYDPYLRTGTLTDVESDLYQEVMDAVAFELSEHRLTRELGIFG